MVEKVVAIKADSASAKLADVKTDKEKDSNNDDLQTKEEVTADGNAVDGETEEELDPEEAKGRMEQQDMRAHAQILEMVGDLRRAEDRPPENVLFVCKLNPVTTDEDLEVIFSRFGQINCCEVIRDRRTGASLQYAFIEFDKPEYCEAAFLKMDNVLIDDRRIHVDFSQSVSKTYQWRHKTTKAPETKFEEVRKSDRRPRRSRSRDDRRKKSGGHHSQGSREANHSEARKYCR